MTLFIFWCSYELIICYRHLALPWCTLGINILVISPSIKVRLNLKPPLVYFTEPIKEPSGGLRSPSCSSLAHSPHLSSLDNRLKAAGQSKRSLQIPFWATDDRNERDPGIFSRQAWAEEYKPLELERSTDNRELLMQGSSFVGDLGFAPFYRTQPNEMEVHCR